MESLGILLNQKIQKIPLAMKEVGFFVEKEVKESISGNRAEKPSVDTGRFLGSVHTTRKSEFEYFVGTRVPYAKYLEYGTSKIKPRRHFRNTASRTKKTIKEYLKTTLKT